MAQSGWTVTSQLANQVKNTDTGNTVEGTYIYFTTDEGNSDAVFVPKNIYRNRHKVRQMISEAAQAIDDIGNMSSDSTG